MIPENKKSSHDKKKSRTRHAKTRQDKTKNRKGRHVHSNPIQSNPTTFHPTPSSTRFQLTPIQQAYLSACEVNGEISSGKRSIKRGFRRYYSFEVDVAEVVAVLYFYVTVIYEEARSFV